MGLLSRLVLLPLAPVEGVVWLADRLADEAERQLADQSDPRRVLAELEAALERGEIDEDEYQSAEDELLQQMLTAEGRPEGDG